MGVPKFYKIFMENVEGIKTDARNPFSLSMDLNGFIHACCRVVYGYGNTLNNEKIDETTISRIRALMRMNNEQSKLELFVNLKKLIEESLTRLVIDTIKPTSALIITLDGKAPFAKCNQQRGRRNKSGMERHKNQFEKPLIDTFDTSHLTAGTKFMNEISNIVKGWIKTNAKKLPYYTLFSGSDIEGEGEHKIYKMLDEIRIAMINNDKTETNKDKDRTFRDQTHVVFGLDADLCFLSMLRDYNFCWLRENFNIFDISDCNRIPVFKEYVINLMKGDRENLSENDKINIIRDFVLISFFIGDDFVPAMFLLTLNIRNSLFKFIDSYVELKLNLTTNNGDIIVSNFSKYIELLTVKEEELFTLRKRVNEVELAVTQESVTPELLEEHANLRKENMVKSVYNDKGKRLPASYYYSPILENDYLTFNSYWRLILSRPALLCDGYTNSTQINSLSCEDDDSLTTDTLDSCDEYLTGLQWNLKYYLGYNVNNWYYKRSFPPTIYFINQFLKSRQYNFRNVLKIAGEQSLTTTQMLVMLLNPNFSRDVLINSFFKNEKEYKSVTSTCKYISCIFPTKILVSLQGKYTSDEHSGIPVMPNVNFNDILRIGKSVNEPHVRQQLYEYLNESQSSTICEFSDILSTKISIGESTIKYIPNRHDVRKVYEDERKKVREEKSKSGRGIRREGANERDFSGRVNPKRQVGKSNIEKNLDF